MPASRRERAFRGWRDYANDPMMAPGPKGLPILGNIKLLTSRDALLLISQWRAQYGDIVRWQVGPRLIHFVSDPEAIKHVLQMNNRNYTKGQGYLRLKVLLGEGLLTSEGEFWRRQRRLAQPAFHRQQIESFADVMVQSTNTMLQSWETLAAQQTPFDVNQSMMRVTLDIVSRCLFHTALSEEEFAQVARSLSFLLHRTIMRVMAPWFIELPTRTNRLYHQNIQQLDRIILRIIEERRRDKKPQMDLLSMLLNARDEETGEGMTDRQLRDEAMTLFLAGHETTANALSWAWMVLSQQPTIREKIEQEVDELLQGRLPTAEDTTKLTYTRAVLDEVMRLYPPVPTFARRAIQDDILGGFHIPAGSNVLISPYVLHRHPDYWENPVGFDPSRFIEESQKERHKFLYLPFGGGPRFCIGNNFAIMEALLIIAMVTQKYRIQLVPHHDIERELSITLRPKNGILATLQPRKPTHPNA